jgi:hypothetical protein
MYLCNSPVHSSTVARVLNLRTGYITAQYYTAHDEPFSTLQNDGTALGLSTPKFLNGLLHTGLKDNVVDVDHCSISRIVAIRNCCFLLDYFKDVR